jgi:hypothetical protein
MDEHQERFLRNEIFRLTLAGTVQRANAYQQNASDGIGLHHRDGAVVHSLAILQNLQVSL